LIFALPSLLLEHRTSLLSFLFSWQPVSSQPSSLILWRSSFQFSFFVDFSSDFLGAAAFMTARQIGGGGIGAASVAFGV
jgi:hypothetical protein